MFSLFRNYLSFEKGMALHLYKLKFPSTLGCFVPSLVEIGPVVLEKKMKMCKVYNNNNNYRKILIIKAHLSFRLRWANNLKGFYILN